MRSVLLTLTGTLLAAQGFSFVLNKSNFDKDLAGDPATEIRRSATAAFEEMTSDIYQSARLADYHLSYEVFRYAMTGYLRLKSEGKLIEREIISVIDFSKPSRERRFYTIDLKNRKVLYHTYVSHGKHTGGDKAGAFSNKPNSNQSSLGFYVTGETYFGSKGFSLRLDGMEPGVNDNMRRRAVVMHDAEYVSENWIRKYGRLGRSLGCPALPKEVSKKIINEIKGRTAIFAYFGDKNYLTGSSYLNSVNEEMLAVIQSLGQS